MTKIKNSLGNRVVALFLSFVMLIGFIPLNAVTVFAAGGNEFGTLSGITAGGTITDANGSNATITYSDGAVLNWSAKDPSIGRSVDGWWIGIKMTAPDTKTTQTDFDGVTYQTRNGNEWSDAKAFWTYKDSSNSADVHYIGLWGVVTEESLNNAITAETAIQYEWQFDWNADGIYEQKVVLNIKPDDVVLKKDGVTVYPSTAGLGSVSVLSDGLTVTNNNSNFVKVSYTSNTVLSWAAADPSVGRMNDGWWYGIKVTAPDTLTTEADFNNVTYQRMDGGSWSEAKSFWTFKDSSNNDSVHYIGLWGLLNEAYLENAEANGKNLQYTWRFDWNKDGIYEQQISLIADPHQITLKDSDGNQVYPSLGTVTTYTGGTVSGTTGNIAVTVDEASLNWSPKDPSIGRNIDAWWVGIKVTAPNYGNSVLKNAKYQRLDYSATEWTANKSFWSNRDSTDSDTSQYVQMWVPLTPAILSQAIEDSVNITTQYRFDWDNNGEFEQLISLVIVPGDGIVLNKVNQTGFKFENEAPVDQWAGSTFTNVASGGQGTGSVKYEIISGNAIASVDENTGAVTFSAAGTITVQATKAADDTYNEATTQYTVTSVRYPQTEFKFNTSNPGAIAFAEGKTFENKAEGGSGSGDVVYEIISGGSCAKIDSATGVVTLLKAGDITVKATKKADAFYNETTATYTLKINKGEQDALIFSTIPADGELVYRTEVYNSAITVSGGSGTGKLTYSIIEGSDVATITPDGKITTLKNGTFKIRAEKDGDEGYLPATAIETTITVIRAEQTTFAFTYPNPGAVTYNENGNKFENPAIGGESEGAVTYAIASLGGEDIVDIDADGTLTIKKAGTVTICANKAEDEKYNSASTTYTFEIKKADQTFSFADGESISKYYGIKSFENSVVYTELAEKADGKGYGSGKVTYTLSGDDIGASVGADGVITFTDSTLKVGKITVKATKAEDDCYNSVEKEYTLTVSYLSTPADPYSLFGEKRNASGWYTGDVAISAADGYKISYSNELSTSDWGDSVVYSDEGINSAVVYLINTNGDITDAIPVNELKIDKTDPAGVDITYSTSLLDKVIETVTFGIYKAPVTVTLTAANDYSGIESFTYNLGGSDVTVDKADFTTDINGVATYEFTIEPQYRGVVTMTATSASGRKVSVTGSKTLVVDTDKPELSVLYEFSSGESHTDDGTIYTQGSTTVYFTVEEANFDISDMPVVKVDGHAIALDWIQNNETKKWETDVDILNPGSHTINVTYQDIATNVMEEYNQVLVLDDDAPTLVSVTYDNNTARNGKYYNAGRKATILISEDYFKPEDLRLGVVVTDVTGADVKLSGTDLDLQQYYLDLLRDKTSWTKVTGNIYKAEIEFVQDGIYDITLNYTDLSGNTMEEWSDSFIVDKTIVSAENVTIEYSTSIIDKVLETVTFGLYQGDVIVTVTANDQTAGVEYFEITYTQVDGQNNSNKATYTTEKLAAVQDANDKTVFTATHTINAQARGKVSVNLIDKAGNTTGKSEEYVVVADTIAPGLEYEWKFTDDQVREYNSIYYTKGETKVAFTIEEANFDLSLKGDDGAAPVLTVNGVAQDTTWAQIDGTDKWATEITLTGNGDYVVELNYTDRSTNAMATYTKEVHIDDEVPVFDVTYDNTEARNENNYKAGRTATVKVTEHNFKAEEVKLTVTAKDITGADVDISTKAYTDYAKNAANWTQVGDVRTLVLPTFDTDAIYSVTLDYQDLAENDAETYTADFVIDKTNPSNVEIKYSESLLDKVLETITFGFYQPKVIVTVTAQDDTAGVEYFKITYTKQTGTSRINTDTYTTDEIIAKQDATTKNIFTAQHTIPANARGTVSVVLLDKAGNGSDDANSEIVVVDNIAPTREVVYTPERILDATTLLDVEGYHEGDNSILYYEKEAVVTFKITEANFDLSLKDEATKPVIKVNSSPVNLEWTNEGDVWTAIHTIEGDGDYVVTMTYMDLSTNTMVDYTSAKISIDNTDPAISGAYNPADAAANGKFFNTDRSMTVTIVEHNFRADDLDVKVTAKDASGASIANEDATAKAIADYLTNRNNWTRTGDTHVATVPLTVDAQYDLTIDYSDLIGNAATQYVAPSFVIDHAAPNNLTISYNQEIRFWEKALNAITFGYYSYKPSVEVTMTAFDDISCVDYFTWTYTQEEATSTTKNVSTRTVVIPSNEITYSADKKTATATFTLTGTDAEQFRGSISFTATDRAANESAKLDDNARINIVDTITPTRVVTYSDAKQVVDAATLQTRTTYDYTGENTNAILYYDDNVTVTVKVTEANFYAEDVVIKDNNTVITPNGWTQNGDVWTATFTLTSEGDHLVTMAYTDRSNNIMTNYESQRIIIDRTAPVINVSYKNTDVKNTVRDSENHDRKYFDTTQVATITITEHNFRPDDVAVRVKAKDAVGSNVSTFSFDAEGNVTKYASEGKSREEWAKMTPFTDAATWRRNGDTYQLEIEYANDANYTFDIEYKDLAGNEAATYSTNYFTVDKTAPKNLTVSYSTNVFENVLESITFGYYNAQMTVTITAEDDISGIYHFLYSYAKSEGVSEVNAELIDDAIRSANISYSGSVATATFTIPKYVLGSDNQFNGTVRFTAFDRAENSTDKSDTERIIVDNIKPTVNVTYNDPVRTANNISYYAGDADVRIDIKEANFYSEDVHVTVTKDNNNYPVTVNWTNNNVDDHTGIFTLSEDGDYVVSVSYADRSGNIMEDYRSNQITVDTTKPTVKVSNITNNTANKDEVYTFTITANDINIDFETFKPELTALVRGENGNYTTETISLGNVKTVEAGKTYSFTVENLDRDAAYALVCVVRDMSGNEYSSIVLDDNNEYSTVQFSINRDGSTFAANSFTEDLVNQYYIYSVDDNIVLEEINVDPIESYVVKLNGKALEEGDDYSTYITSNDGEWSKRTYVVSKDLFKAEGEYSIVIESTDKADTKAYSDVKNLKIAFVVDQTAPVLTVSGVEDCGRYQIEEQPVTVIPTDDGGRLYSFKAIVLDSAGNPLIKDGVDVSVRFEMSGEELLQYLEEHEGKITFTIPDGLENQVQLVCNDCALKADGTTNEYSYTYTKVTVSLNGWLIFYANKPLFYGSIGGVVVLAALVSGLIIFLKKRKKSKEPATN